MKTNLKRIFAAVFFAAIAVTPALAQDDNDSDSTGVPGDNFSLQGALELFQKANSPEDFEKMLNTESNKVNNLDLNGDGEIDYIKVIDRSKDDAHAFVLQAVISETENQDVAVIELEKTGKESAEIQIVGDEEIYGEEITVEPNGDTEEMNDNKKDNGPSFQYDNLNKDNRVVVNVWFWPSVRFVYAPAYRPWISPWRWRAYPGWFHPWRPIAWRVYHPYWRPYHHRYVIVAAPRLTVAHNIYRPYRTTSVTVKTRHATAIGNYKVTKSRTIVTGPRGKKATIKKTSVTGPRGNRATKVKVRKH